jgi:hypothetical protein
VRHLLVEGLISKFNPLYTLQAESKFSSFAHYHRYPSQPVLELALSHSLKNFASRSPIWASSNLAFAFDQPLSHPSLNSSVVVTPRHAQSPSGRPRDPTVKRGPLNEPTQLQNMQSAIDYLANQQFLGWEPGPPPPPPNVYPFH